MVEDLDVEWVESTASSFLSAPNIALLPKIKSNVLETSIAGYLSIISGIIHVGLPLSTSVLVNSNVDNDNENDQSDSGSTDSSDTNDTDTEITPVRQIRSLTVVELVVNTDLSCADCVFDAAPFLFFKRKLPEDVPAYVNVCVYSGKPLQQLPTCATINEVSRLFKYNRDQHLAFAIGGRALLGIIAHETVHDDMLDSAIAMLQRLVEIHGMGGTGKSHVINGWIALSVSWSRPHAIGTFAITGVAAITVSGRTFASLVYSFLKYGGLTDSLRKKWQSKRVMIIDEMSLLQGLDLNKLSNFCKALTGRHNLVFGGIIVILAGDFFQLPPVAGKSLYIDPGGNSAAKAGFELYRLFTDVVVLTEVRSALLFFCALFYSFLLFS